MVLSKSIYSLELFINEIFLTIWKKNKSEISLTERKQEFCLKHSSTIDSGYCYEMAVKTKKRLKAWLIQVNPLSAVTVFIKASRGNKNEPFSLR